MKFRLLGLFALICALAIIVWNKSETTHSQTKKSLPALSQAEQDLLNEINQARANPQLYAGYLEKLKPRFKGKQYTTETLEVETQEGWIAVEDAISFLRAAKPVGPLNAADGLNLAASSHVKEQSASGATGHTGADKMLIEERVKPFGTWQGDLGENLTYGNDSARERVLTWLIDDGFANRNHRKRVMGQNYKVAGISCGPHPEYGAMCVLALAGGFTGSTVTQVQTNNSKSSGTLKNSPPTANLKATVPSNSNTNTNSNTTRTSNGAANANNHKPNPRKL
jgi:uncharacterized protein YkwD